MYKNKPVTFVILSCRRTHLLEDVIAVFRKNCLDADLVDHWLMIDDSHDIDHHKMVSTFTDFETILKTPDSKGHARSLNMIFDRFRDGYLVYWEDDAVLPTRGAWISQAIEILTRNPDLLQVTFDQDLFTAPWHQDNPSAGQVHYPFAYRKYLLPPDAKFVDPRDFVFYVDAWPGYTLRPNVLDLDRFHSCVRHSFDETLRQNFEYEMALAVHRAKLSSAGFLDCDICDVGALSSSYAANYEVRSFEAAGGLYSSGHFRDIKVTCAQREDSEKTSAQWFQDAQRWMFTDQARQAAMHRRGLALLKE